MPRTKNLTISLNYVRFCAWARFRVCGEVGHSNALKSWYTPQHIVPETIVTTITIVGHLHPDLDCLAAMWMLQRWGNLAEAELQFVPAGTTLDNRPVDADPHIIHVDTGNGRFDHHMTADTSLSGSELVRRVVAPDDPVLERMVDTVTLLDHAHAEGGTAPTLLDLIEGLNLLHPDAPQTVAAHSFVALDAWHARESKQSRLEVAFENRIEFDTPWGFGIAMESEDGGSSRLAFRAGAVLYIYRDGKRNVGIIARSRSAVDLTQVLRDIRRIDPDADWYLHPSKRLLVCGTPKAPPRTPSHLSLDELIGVLRGDYLF